MTSQIGERHTSSALNNVAIASHDWCERQADQSKLGHCIPRHFQLEISRCSTSPHTNWQNLLVIVYQRCDFKILQYGS